MAKCIIHHISKKILDAVVVCHLKKFFWCKAFYGVRQALFHACRVHCIVEHIPIHAVCMLCHKPDVVTRLRFSTHLRAYGVKIGPALFFPLCANVQHIALCGGVDDECSDRDAYSRGQPALAAEWKKVPPYSMQKKMAAITHPIKNVEI